MKSCYTCKHRAKPMGATPCRECKPGVMNNYDPGRARKGPKKASYTIGGKE